ncbi:MAG: FHA domain-containing protein, partial [Planctomycetota bacterium]
MVTLAIRRADLVGTERVVNLDGPSVIIGRSPTCTICLADQTVSRLHAEMTRHDDGTWSISSYKTAQKLWVNGVSVDASPLRGGETIRIGPYMIRFQLHAAESGTDERIAPCPAAVSAHDARKSATLFVEAGSPTLGRVPIVSPATVIGRSDACDLTIVAAQCADKQAEIHHVDNGFVLRDLGEESGVFLNGHRMNANTELATADIIALANGSPPARGHKRNAILRMVDAWQQWPAICQVGTAAALALAIVALFTAPAVMARASKSIAFVALRKIARETASTDNATPVAEEAASAAPVEEGHDDADPLTTELDADRESPAETVDPPSPPAAAPHLASSLATEPDATDDDR